MSERKLTITEAQALAAELQHTIEWIEPFLDEKVADALELNIEKPPAHIREYLEQEIKQAQNVKRYVERVIEHAMNKEPLITIDEGLNKYTKPVNK